MEEEKRDIIDAARAWLEEHHARRGKPDVVGLLQENLDRLRALRTDGWTVDDIAQGLIVALDAQVTTSTMRLYLYRAGFAEEGRRRRTKGKGQAETEDKVVRLPAAVRPAPVAIPPMARPPVEPARPPMEPAGHFPTEIPAEDL